MIRGEMWNVGKLVDCCNAPLYLLDTNFPAVTVDASRLYGGGPGPNCRGNDFGHWWYPAYQALGWEADLYHFNEGHAVFAGLELIRR